MSIVDLDADRFVIDIDISRSPCRDKYDAWSGVASPIAMEDAMVPHPTNPARIGRIVVVVVVVVAGLVEEKMSTSSVEEVTPASVHANFIVD